MGFAYHLFSTYIRVSFRIFIKRGANTTIAELKEARIVLVFLSAKNNIVLINLFILGGSGGMLHQENLYLTAETVSGGF